ncbi:MAG: baseplate J/gp47 family protein [Bacteroides sp.]
MEGQDSESIHKRMMDALPDDIDDTQGGFPWDFTKPTADEKAELLEFELMEGLKLMHPMWAYGEGLDIHANEVGLPRKAANAASGYVAITGISGTRIPKGFVFAVPATGGAAAIEYQVSMDTDIDSKGTASVLVKAVVAGTSGNVAADTIVIMATPMTGITGITNPNPITGGTEEESDDDLWQRIDDANANAGESFVGNDSDYKRWAEEVHGVGTALTISEWNGPGTVKVILLDSNGEAANPTIIAEVYNHIVSPDDRSKRKAPIGATVTVDKPNELTINYAFSLTLEYGHDVSTVVTAFKATMLKYYIEAKEEDTVRYTRVAAVLTAISGVIDHSGLTMNGGVTNIAIKEDGYPVTGTVTVL